MKPREKVSGVLPAILPRIMSEIGTPNGGLPETPEDTAIFPLILTKLLHKEFGPPGPQSPKSKGFTTKYNFEIVFEFLSTFAL